MASLEEKNLLDRIAAPQLARKLLKKAGTPEVGIIFLVGTKLFVEGEPVSSAEVIRVRHLPLDAQFVNFDGNHDNYWDRLKAMGAVPRSSEYDDFPRGRVVYNVATGRYRLFADACILAQKSVVAKIIALMNLPSAKLEISTDDHYVCLRCLRTQR
jgi:hypothetical protein